MSLIRFSAILLLSATLAAEAASIPGGRDAWRKLLEMPTFSLEFSAAFSEENGIALSNDKPDPAVEIPKLRAQLQDAIDCMKKDGSLTKLSEKWLGYTPGPDALERVITPGYGVPGMPGYDPTPHELHCG